MEGDLRAAELSFPTDEAPGLVCRCMPSAAKLLCHETARSQSYLQSSETLALSGGIAVSPSRIHRLVRAVGPDLEAWALSRTPPRAEPGRDIIVCLQMDMAGVRMLRRYLDGVKGRDGAPAGRQIKCGTLFLMERDAEGKCQRIACNLLLRPVAFSAALEKARQKLAAPHGTRLVVVSDGPGGSGTSSPTASSRRSGSSTSGTPPTISTGSASSSPGRATRRKRCSRSGGAR